jgi:phosphoribosylanthranilate isomerase
MIRVKVCGLQPGDDITFAAHPRVTHVGFVFVPASRRYVPPDRARAVVDTLPSSVRAAGVFVDAPVPDVLACATAAGVRTVQLHGKESPQACKTLRDAGYEVWKALPVTDMDPAAIAKEILRYAAAADAILLDAAPPKQAAPGVTGGHGRPFDWAILPRVGAALADAGCDVTLWVAGGIRPDNVGLLLAQFVPAGIDVSSGVEENGRKSPEKIQALLEVVDNHVSAH